MISINWDLYKNIDQLPEVTDPKILKTNGVNIPTEEGIYSEQIFGPKKDNRCQCGEIFSKANKGVICPKCKVECTSKDERSKRFAKIKLPPAVRVINPSLKNFLRKLIGSAFKEIIDYTKKEINYLDPFYFCINEFKLIKKSKLKDSNIVSDKYPVYNIYTLGLFYDELLKYYKLAKKRKDNLEKRLVKIKSENRINKVKLILDNYKKIIELFNNATGNDEMLDYVFLKDILVIPPETRPLFPMKSGKFNVPEISAVYVEILKNKKNSEFDILFENNPNEWGYVIFKYQKSIDSLFKIINEETFQKSRNVMKESITGKTIDYSQRSVIVPDPTLHPNTMSLSYESFHKIFQPFIKEYKFNKYQEDESYNVTNYIRYIQDETLSQDGNIYLSNDELQEFLSKSKDITKILAERAPVLYSFNVSGYHVTKILLNDAKIGIPNNQVMGVNTMESKKFNFDFDGDTMAAFSITSEEAQKEFPLFDSANSKKFEHNGAIIPEPEHESIYAAFMLIKQPKIIIEKNVHIIDDKEIYDNYDSFKPNIKSLNKEPHKRVVIGEDEMFYSVATFNKACNINISIIKDQDSLDKRKMKYVLNELYHYDEDKFYDNLHNLNKFLLECSSVVSYCSPTFDSKDFDIYNEEIISYKKTLINEPFIGFHQNDILFNDLIIPEVKKNHSNILNLVFESGARIKSVQLLKAASNNGIPTDINGKGKAINTPQSLLEGKTAPEFYIESDSARLALAQRQDAIPKGGELQRKFYYQYGYLKQSFEEDCGCQDGLNIEIKNQTHLNSLDGRWYKINKEDKWRLINPRKKEELIGLNIILRSATHCKSKNYKICKRCLGELRPQSANLGTKIGAYVSESIIQSVLRTHHFSGAFITEIKKELKEIMSKLEFQSPDFIKYKDKKDLDDLKNYMIKYYYKEDDFEFKKVSKYKDTYKVKLVVHNLPYNDDAVKLLLNIISVIDINREGDKLMPKEEMYYKLCENIIFPNKIYSYLIELIISMMYYDEDGVLSRYSSKQDYKQFAIKNIISNLDPRLTIFYKLTDSSITNILTTNKFEEINHMYYDLLKYYK